MIRKEVNTRISSHSIREPLFDVIRGLAIVLVIFGHNIQFGSGKVFLEGSDYYGQLIFKFIYTFHMPAFAFVSGYLYHASVQHHDTIEIIKRKFRSIILPLLAWSLILSIVGTQYRSIDSIMIVVAKNYLSNVGYSLWFLWGVLFCSLLVLVQTRLQKYVPFKLSCFILVLLTLISPRNYNIYLYSFIYPFFIFGFLMSETDIIKELKRLSKKNVLCVTVIFFFIQLAGMLVFEPGDFVYVSGSNVLLPFSLPKMGAFVLRIVFGTTGICFTILFSRLLQIVLESKSRVMEIICRFGQLSLTGYALDTAVIQIIFPQIEGTLSPHLFRFWCKVYSGRVHPVS